MALFTNVALLTSISVANLVVGFSISRTTVTERPLFVPIAERTTNPFISVGQGEFGVLPGHR